jgi:hypothetical protein
VELDRISTRPSHFSNPLTALDDIVVFCDVLAVVGIDGIEIVGVLDDHQLPVAGQRLTDINHFPVSSGKNRIAQFSFDIQALVGRLIIRTNNPSFIWPFPNYSTSLSSNRRTCR